MYIAEQATLLVLALLLLLVQQCSATTIPPAQHFNLTAISATNGKSTLECWQLVSPITTSATAGTTGAKVEQLGNVANISYSVIPPKFDAGKHNAPMPQYVQFLSGLAHVTLPDGSDEVWVTGGAYGLIIAVDVAGKSVEGHITDYPSNSTTALLQIPFKGGVTPNHTVLHYGPCRRCEITLPDLQPKYC